MEVFGFSVVICCAMGFISGVQQLPLLQQGVHVAKASSLVDVKFAQGEIHLVSLDSP